MGPENLLKPAISAAIKERVAGLAASAGLTPEDVWREWGHICRASIGDVIDFTGVQPTLKPAGAIPEAALRAISSMKVKRYVEGDGDDALTVEVVEFKFWDKPGTLSTVAKAMGELIDRVEHTGPKGGPITHEHAVHFPDVSADEFRSLPAEERLRRLREAVQAINRN
jgi:phage terminase small subunit